MSAERNESVTSESARDVLRERIARKRAERSWGKDKNVVATWEGVSDRVRETWLADADEAIDDALAHPTELLALLAEPKVCDICQGRGSIPMIPRMEMTEVCSSCHGSGVDESTRLLLGRRAPSHWRWVEDYPPYLPRASTLWRGGGWVSTPELFVEVINQEGAG